MQFTCRALFSFVIILIFLREVHSRGIDPLIGEVNRYRESDQVLRDNSDEKQNVVKESDMAPPSEVTSGPSFDVNSNKHQDVPGNQSSAAARDKERHPRGGPKSFNHIRMSNSIPEPTMCFQFSSRNSNEPPMTVCEPIKVARQAPGDSSTVRYNPFIGISHSSTPLVVLPPNPIIQRPPPKTTRFPSPLTPGYGFQPQQGSYILPHYHNIPPLQLTQNLSPYPPSQVIPAKTTILQTPLPPGYAYQTVEDRDVFPPDYYDSRLQLQSSLPPNPPSQVIPAKTTIMQPPFPPAYAGYQLVEDREVFPPFYYDASRQPRPSPASGSATPTRRPMLKTQLPPRYGYHPFRGRYILPSDYYPSPLQVSPVFAADPMSQFAPSKSRLLESPALPVYELQPAEMREIFLAKYDISPPQVPASLPQNYISQFRPTNTELPETWPPGYGFQPFVNRYTNTPYHNMPSPQIPLYVPYPQMNYVPSSTPVFTLPYTPNLFTVYGRPDKLQSSNSKTPALTSPSKSGLPPTIKEQEDAHTVPTPLEETEKSQDYLSSRAAALHLAPQYLSEELPVSPSYGLNIVYNPNLAQPKYFVRDKLYPNSESYPSSAMQFTTGQNSKGFPATAAEAEFGQSVPPAALTCKVHNSEDMEAKQITTDDSIAILQLFLKPNPTRYNKYRQNVPEDGTSIAGNSDVRETLTSPGTQYVETKTITSSKNITSRNKAGKGQSTMRDLMGNLKEEEIPSQGRKHFHGEQNKTDGPKWNEEQRGKQQYLEQGALQSVLVPTMSLPAASDPWMWYQGQMAPPQVAYTPHQFYNGRQPTLGERPYYETNVQQQENLTPQQWSGVPQNWWGSPQLQFWNPYYQQPAQFPPANQSLTDQYLNNQLLLKVNKHALHVQKKLPDVKNIPPLEAQQERINEAMEKQLRLNAMKAKLLQQYQSKAAEKRERSKQVSVSGIYKFMNSSAKVNLAELSANIQSKQGDSEGNSPQIKLSAMGSRKSEDTEMSRENSNRLIQSTKNSILGDYRHASHKARSMSHQAEMPVNSTQMYEQNFATNDKSLNAETTSDGNTANWENMDSRASYLEQGISFELGQPRNTNNENSSYPAKTVTYLNSSKPSVNTNSENSSTEEGEISGYMTSSPEENITYPPPERQINLKNAVTDSRKTNAREQDVKMVPDKTSDNLSQPLEDTDFSEQASNGDFDQTPLNINSTEVPHMSDNPKDTLISKNPSWLRESEMNVTALPKVEMMPVTPSMAPSGMMTKASAKFHTLGNVTDNTAFASTPKSGSNSEEDSKAESNSDDSSSTKTKKINFRYNEDDVSDYTEAEEVTSSDVVFTSGPRDSILSERGISSDSHKTDFSDKENKQANIYTSDTTQQAQHQERQMPASDVLGTEMTSDVSINSEGMLLSEGQTADHDMKPEISSKQLLISESSSYRNANLLSNGYNSSMVTTFSNNTEDRNSSDSQIFDTNDDQIIGNITESETSFKSMDLSPVSEGISPGLWESTPFTQDQSTNNASELYPEIADVVRGTTASIKTEPWTSHEVATGRSPNETSNLSDEIIVISSEDGKPWGEAEDSIMSKSLEDSKALHVEPSEKGRSSEIDSSTADVHNAPNNDAFTKRLYDILFSSKIQPEDSEMIPDQENERNSAGHQINFESDFPQAPSNRMRPGHSHHGNIGNSGVTRTETFPIFSFAPPRGQVVRPSVVYPAAMKFMVYPKGTHSAPNHNYKSDPWPFAKVFPRPYTYHVPYTPDYSIRYSPHYYSNIPLRNNIGDQRMTEEGTRGRAQKDTDGQTVQGKLPFVVVLEE
jgi:hypothetical protein